MSIVINKKALNIKTNDKGMTGKVASHDEKQEFWIKYEGWEFMPGGRMKVNPDRRKNQVSQNKILARVWSYNDCQTPTETTLKKEGNTQETKSDWTGYNTYTSVYFTSKTTARGKITRLFSRLTSPWKVYVSHQRQWRKKQWMWVGRTRQTSSHPFLSLSNTQTEFLISFLSFSLLNH